jgi:3-phosphoshikimate 1-carboxyvinyltransferase
MMRPATPDRFTVAPGGALRGRSGVPGDKSISHRAAILAALSEGDSRIDNFLEADDCLATLDALRQLGVASERLAPGEWRISGVGQAALRAPAAALDLRNSGTALRLLLGALAGAPIEVMLTGDASLVRRPMERVAAPLRAMGAEVSTTAGTPPVRLRGARPLRGVDWTPEVASAQVKSAILLAGLASEEEVVVREPHPTRDHTERLCAAFDVDCLVEEGRVRLGARRRPRPATIAIPGDLSAAAALIVGAAMTPGSDLTIEGVGLNPTRCGVLDALRQMGAEIDSNVVGDCGAEPWGTLRVRGAQLEAIELGGALVANAIDELPLLMIAAASARGLTRLRDAAELSRKESDRLATTAAGLAALGIAVDRHADGLSVTGGQLRGGTVAAAGDHRIAMAFAIAALRASGPVEVHGAAGIATSFPGFHETARHCGLRLAPEAAA